MSDSIAPIMAFASGAWLLTLGLFPLAAVFIVAGVAMWLTYGAQKQAHQHAVQTGDPTPARGVYIFGLILVAAFILAALYVGQMSGLEW